MAASASCRVPKIESVASLIFAVSVSGIRSTTVHFLAKLAVISPASAAHNPQLVTFGTDKREQISNGPEKTLRAVGSCNPAYLSVLNATQWCMKIAKRRIIGSGIPISYSKAPLPKSIPASSIS
jgi:hypothetical protein